MVSSYYGAKAHIKADFPGSRYHLGIKIKISFLSFFPFKSSYTLYSIIQVSFLF